MLTRWVQGFFHHNPGSEGVTETGLASLAELTAYCEEKIKERRKSPVDSPEAINALASFETDGKRFSDADAALYYPKESGRNRVVTATAKLE